MWMAVAVANGDETRRDEAKRDKTRHDKTGRDETERNETAGAVPVNRAFLLGVTIQIGTKSRFALFRVAFATWGAAGEKVGRRASK